MRNDPELYRGVQCRQCLGYPLGGRPEKENPKPMTTRPTDFAQRASELIERTTTCEHTREWVPIDSYLCTPCIEIALRAVAEPLEARVAELEGALRELLRAAEDFGLGEVEYASPEAFERARAALAGSGERTDEGGGE
jgi:hypothetical protein